TGWFGSPAESKAAGVYGNIENSTELHFKYAVLLDQPVEYLTNLSLLQFIEDWYGTRYRFGGNTKQGVDCSGFTCNLSNSVFGKTLPRTAREQYEAAQKIPVEYLQE
ncbi:NlpC/P60 family protein, partial [Flavihumibacter sediminis]|nr:NlpC/P60 family protein [Flavihumibacter sediminis]